MKLYYAGSSKKRTDDYIIKNNLPRLQSYVNDKSNIKNYFQHIRNKAYKDKLFVDSGAFTMWTKGQSLDVDEYIKWINDNSDYLGLFGQVDSIPGDRVYGATAEQVKEAAGKTWENYLYMLKRVNNKDGLLYTFHIGEPFDYLKQALEYIRQDGTHIPYIALGGMVGKPKESRVNFLIKCFDIIKKSSNPNVKVHAFGMTDWEILEAFPFESADSTSWLMTGAMGGIMTDFGVISVSSQSSKDITYFKHLPTEYLEKFEELLKKSGFTINELQNDYAPRRIFNIMYMQSKLKNLKVNPNKFTKKSLF